MSELHEKVRSFAEKGLNVSCLQFFEPGRSICFTDVASTILSEQWYQYRKELLLPPQI